MLAIIAFLHAIAGASATRGLERALLERPTKSAFQALETHTPPPPNLLAQHPDALDGRWKLISTVAAGADADVDADSAVVGSINASGIVLDASAERLPIQQICCATGRIGNEIRFKLAFLSLIVRVAGSFEPDVERGCRALVEFDTLDLFVDVAARPRRLLRAGFLFGLIRRLRPALTNGAESASWLETSYISPSALEGPSRGDVRLGRGNKGSIFVLEREAPSEVGPLAPWRL